MGFPIYSICFVSKQEIRTEISKKTCFTAVLLCNFALITHNAPLSLKGSIATMPTEKLSSLVDLFTQLYAGTRAVNFGTLLLRLFLSTQQPTGPEYKNTNSVRRYTLVVSFAATASCLSLCRMVSVRYL